MIEPQGKPGTFLTLPVDAGARAIPSYRNARGGVPSGVAFDSEIARGRQNPFAQTVGGEGDPITARAFEPTTQAFSDASFLGGNAGAAPFLAQQIAQEMMADSEYVSPEQAAASAIGSYRAAPVSSITYDGPQVALDITV